MDAQYNSGMYNISQSQYTSGYLMGVPAMERTFRYTNHMGKIHDAYDMREKRYHGQGFPGATSYYAMGGGVPKMTPGCGSPDPGNTYCTSADYGTRSCDAASAML